MAAMSLSLLLCQIALLNAKKYKFDKRTSTNGWQLQEYTLAPEMVGEHFAAQMVDDNIYLFGGLHLNPFYGLHHVAQVRATSSQTQAWQIVTDMTVEDGFEQPWFTSTNNAHTLSSYPSDIFLSCEDSQHGQIWKFDTNTLQFQTVAIMPVLLEDCCVVSRGDTMYIIGGDDNQNVYNLTQIYHYPTDEWIVGAAIPTADGLEQHSCVNVNDEYLYAFGGSHGRDVAQLSANKNAYKYDIVNDEWKVIVDVFDEVAEYQQGVSFLGVNAIPHTPYILVSGGTTATTPTTPRQFVTTVLLFNVERDQVELDADVPQLNKRRGGAAYAVSMHRNRKKQSIVRIYAIGGVQNEDEPMFTDTTEMLKIKIKH